MPSTSIVLLSPRYDSRLAELAAAAISDGMPTALCAPAGNDLSRLPLEAADVAVVEVTEDAGVVLVQEVLQRHPGLPLMVLTAADDFTRRLEALAMGAADYLVMPCDFDAFQIRVRTLSARFGRSSRRPVIRYGQLTLDPGTNRLRTGQGSLPVTPREQEALALMLRSPNRAVSKSLIKRALAEGQELSDNAIEVLICRLRSKTRRHGLDIQTSRGQGYVLTYGGEATVAAQPTP